MGPRRGPARPAHGPRRQAPQSTARRWYISADGTVAYQRAHVLSPFPLSSFWVVVRGYRLSARWRVGVAVRRFLEIISQADLRKNGFWRPISAPEAPFALKFEVHIGPSEGKTRVENTRF